MLCSVCGTITADLEGVAKAHYAKPSDNYNQLCPGSWKPAISAITMRPTVPLRGVRAIEIIEEAHARMRSQPPRTRDMLVEAIIGVAERLRRFFK